MSDEPLDELYLVWLYKQIGDPDLKSKRRTHWRLARALYTTEFVWFVPNDDARVEDGRDLRYEFLQDEGIEYVDPDWLMLGCSYLELLIGLSRRLEFLMDSRAEDWFWHLMRNLDLHELNDAFNGPLEDIVEEVTERVTWRNYRADGYGGLFPLRNAAEDQTRVEIWYQMSAYVIELG